jgi:hypothetical protein
LCDDVSSFCFCASHDNSSWQCQVCK